MSDHHSDNNNKGRKFFGFEVSNTVVYVLVAVLAIIFVRQILVAF